MEKRIMTTLFFMAILLPFIVQAAVEEPHKLECKLLEMIDGHSYGVNKERIGFTLQLREHLRKMLHGIKQPSGQYRGIFIHQGKYVTLTDLCALEENSRGPELPADLQETLSTVIDYFVEKILPFSEHAQGIQKILLMLISDSCAKRNRPNSFLLTWAECPHGKEAKVLHKEMTSFKKLDEFIADLMNFLTDFVHSCPVARGQFIAMIKEKNNTHHEDNHKN